MSEPLRNYLDFAVETAYLAGRETLGHFQTGVKPDLKADHSPVTVADRRSEELIRRRIQDRFPRHAIVGEEYGVKEAEGVDAGVADEGFDGRLVDLFCLADCVLGGHCCNCRMVWWL